jgi:hypothetical protein
MNDGVDKKGIFKALIFAVLLAFIGIGILGWQYRRIESEQIPALEEKIEQKAAESSLEKFIHARIEGNEKTARGYLTEPATEELNQGKFVLLDGFEKYTLLGSEKLSDERYRFIVKMFQVGGRSDYLEIVIMTKILGQYYIDSVELGG